MVRRLCVDRLYRWCRLRRNSKRQRWPEKHNDSLGHTIFGICIGCALASSFNELVIYRIIGGVGIGVVSIISPLYISEVSVPQYRGRLVSLYQLAITIGFLGAYLVNYQLVLGADAAAQSSNQWIVKIFSDEIWRGMLGMETVPALLFFLIIFFIPESPRWLVLKNKEMRASRILQRIYGSKSESEVQISAIRQVAGGESKSEWSLLLRPGILKAVIIGASIAILGQFMGVNAVLYYGPSIFQESGLSSGDSLFYQVLVGMVNMLTTVLALVIIDKVGRKKLVYYGVSGMIISLVLIAFYFIKGAELQIPSTALLIFFLSYIFCCAYPYVLLSGYFYPKCTYQSPGTGYVHCRILALDRNIPHRTTYPLDATEPYSGGYIPHLRRHVRSIHSDYMEISSRNHRKKPRRNRKELE